MIKNTITLRQFIIPLFLFLLLVLLLAVLSPFGRGYFLGEKKEDVKSTASPGEQKAFSYTEKDLLASQSRGPYIHFRSRKLRGNETFSSSQSIVATYYYYWYDYDSQAHFIDNDYSDALTDHLVNPKEVSWKKTSWHHNELKDMIEAGIDVVLPVYWGEPAIELKTDPDFSNEGLPHLVSAYRVLKSRGEPVPKIGMFYDTTTFDYNGIKQKIDLSTPEGKAWFYVTIRDFFSQVPPEAWATLDGRPIIFLYVPNFAVRGADDPNLFPYVYEHFAQDFGGAKPYIVAEDSWKNEADSKYNWGSVWELKVNKVASLGPGYDDGAVMGRTRQVKDRKGGEEYSNKWEKLLSLSPEERPKMVAIETWNEFHEGSEIAESVEYGRQYIQLTRKYADLWKRGIWLR